MKKSKSRFQNPHGGGYRPHTQIHKAKNKYDRKTSKNLTESINENVLKDDFSNYYEFLNGMCEELQMHFLEMETECEDGIEYSRLEYYKDIFISYGYTFDYYLDAVPFDFKKL